MKLVYCHNRDTQHNFLKASKEVNPRGGSTVAMEAIQSWVLDQLQQGDTIVRKVGIARCSLDDNYNKKKGREIAESRLKQTTLTVVNLIKIGTEYTVVFFEDDNDNLFEVKKSKDPHCAILVRMLDD